MRAQRSQASASVGFGWEGRSRCGAALSLHENGVPATVPLAFGDERRFEIAEFIVNSRPARR